MNTVVDNRINPNPWVQSVKLPASDGQFELQLIENTQSTEMPHVVLCKAQDPSQIPLIRIHSECLTGDVFGSCRCECGPQLLAARKRIGQTEHGYLFYLRQEGRGIGLVEKMKAYLLQERGLDTAQANLALGHGADERTYEMVAQFLQGKGISEVKLMSNNPDKCKALQAYGIAVHRVPLEIEANPYNKRYLQTKREFFKHHLTGSGLKS